MFRLDRSDNSDLEENPEGRFIQASQVDHLGRSGRWFSEGELQRRDFLQWGVGAVLWLTGQAIGNICSGFIGGDEDGSHYKRCITRPLDSMQLPSNISDEGLLYFVTAPLHESYVIDTLIENADFSAHFHGGKFLLVDAVMESRGRYSNERVYEFTIPSPQTGEAPQDQTKDKMLDVSLADALNTLCDTSLKKEEELKEFIAWWYSTTFFYTDRSRVRLDSNDIRIEKDQHGTISNVLYSGTLKNPYIIFNRVEPLRGIPEISQMTNRRIIEEARPMIDTNSGRLLFWPGVNQNFRIPEKLLRLAEILRSEHSMVGPDGENLTITIRGDELALTIRDYFAARKRAGVIEYAIPSRKVRFMDSAPFVNPDDPIALQIAEKINNPEADDAARIFRTLRFMQKNFRYIPENEVSAERPLGATILKGGGDCDNLAVAAATMLAAQDLPVAFVSAVPVGKSEEVFAGHEMIALPYELLKDFLADNVSVYDAEGSRWVLVELTNPNAEIGDPRLSSALEVKHIQPFKPKTRNSR